jgi:hypothetical protein
VHLLQLYNPSARKKNDGKLVAASLESNEKEGAMEI